MGKSGRGRGGIERGGPTWHDSSRPIQAGNRRIGRVLGRGVVLAGLVGLSAWTWTRSEALGEAEVAYRRARDPLELSNALRLALDHLDRRPWSRPAALLAARCLSRLDFADDAERYYQRVGLARLGRDDLKLRAFGIMRSNRREQALAAYRLVLKRWPEDLDAWRTLGGIELTMSRWEEAAAAGQRLGRVPGGAAIGHRLAATALHRAANPEAAIAEAEALLRIDPDLASVAPAARSIFWSELAQDLMAIGRLAEARRVLDKALGTREDAVLLILLGQAYLREGDRDRAETAFQRALAVTDRAGSAWLGLGQIALQRGRPAEAIEPLRRARRLLPRAFEAAHGLANAYRQLGQGASARHYQEVAEMLRRQASGATRGMGAPVRAQP